MVSAMPKNRLMEDCEWRALGIKQGPHWEHYLIHKPGKLHLLLCHSFDRVNRLEPFVLLFRRLLKYRVEPDPAMQQQNTHFPTTRLPASASLNLSASYPLGDSTNTKKNILLRGTSIHGAALRSTSNPFKVMHDHIDEEDIDDDDEHVGEANELEESGFVSHCEE